MANVPHVNKISVAEHTIFLMIYLAKNIKHAQEGITQRRVVSVLGTELYDKTLTIVGLGSIGAEVAKRAKAFGMNIIAITKRPQLRNKIVQNVTFTGKSNYTHILDSFAVVDQIRGIEDLEYALTKSDYISIHTPLNNETESMIGVKEFSLMKRILLFDKCFKSAHCRQKCIIASFNFKKDCWSMVLMYIMRSLQILLISC